MDKYLVKRKRPNPEKWLTDYSDEENSKRPFKLAKIEPAENEPKRSERSMKSTSKKGVKKLKTDLKWRKISAEGLNLDYCVFLTKEEGDELFVQCEKELIYNTGKLAKIQIFGKWIDIPRKQASVFD